MKEQRIIELASAFSLALLLVVCTSCTKQSKEFTSYFITEIGTHVLHDNRSHLTITTDGYMINYRVHQSRVSWGPTEARIDPNEEWYFYVDKPTQVWLRHGEELSLLSWNHKASGTHGVFKTCFGGPNWKLVRMIPGAVLERLSPMHYDVIKELPNKAVPIAAIAAQADR